MNTNTVQNIPVDRIVPGDNDRKTFNRVKLAELAESIREHGLAQPITLRPIGPDLYQIVAGERRFRAVSGILGWPTVPALVRELDDEEASAIMLAENVHRADLSPVEEAMAYQKRIDEFGWSVAEVAAHASVSEGKVASRVKLLNLTPEIRHLIDIGDLPIGFGEALSVLDVNRQRIALAWVREQPAVPTVRAFGAIVSKLHQEQVQESLFDLNALLQPQVVAAIAGSESGQLSEMLPARSDLPDLPCKLGGIGRILDAYIAELIDRRQTAAAEVLLDLWVKLMDANYGSVAPLESETLRRLQGLAAGTVADTVAL